MGVYINKDVEEELKPLIELSKIVNELQDSLEPFKFLYTGDSGN